MQQEDACTAGASQAGAEELQKIAETAKPSSTAEGGGLQDPADAAKQLPDGGNGALEDTIDGLVPFVDPEQDAGSELPSLPSPSPGTVFQ